MKPVLRVTLSQMKELMTHLPDAILWTQCRGIGDVYRVAFQKDKVGINFISVKNHHHQDMVAFKIDAMSRRPEWMPLSHILMIGDDRSEANDIYNRERGIGLEMGDW